MNIIDELAEQIAKAENQAFLKGIKANAVCLNKDFDYVNGFLVAGINNNPRFIKPMVCGKHVFVGELPADYSFALTEIDESKFETELDYYKRRCEELEQIIMNIKGELEVL